MQVCLAVREAMMPGARGDGPIGLLTTWFAANAPLSRFGEE
jgi:hypothetical protein